MSHFKDADERIESKRGIHLSITGYLGVFDFCGAMAGYALTDISKYNRNIEALLSMLNEGSRSKRLDFPDLDLWGPHGAWDYSIQGTRCGYKEEEPREMRVLDCLLEVCSYLPVPGLENYLKRLHEQKHIGHDKYVKHLKILQQYNTAVAILSEIKTCKEIDIDRLKADFLNRCGLYRRDDLSEEMQHLYTKESNLYIQFKIAIKKILFNPRQNQRIRAFSVYVALLHKVEFSDEGRKLVPFLRGQFKGYDSVTDNCMEMAMKLLPPPPKKPEIDETAYF